MVEGVIHVEYSVWVLRGVVRQSGTGPSLLFLDELQSSKDPGPRPPQLFPGTYMDICFFTESLVALEDSGNREFVNPAEPGREGTELGKRMGEARNMRL